MQGCAMLILGNLRIRTVTMAATTLIALAALACGFTALKFISSLGLSLIHI